MAKTEISKSEAPILLSIRVWPNCPEKNTANEWVAARANCRRSASPKGRLLSGSLRQGPELPRGLQNGPRSRNIYSGAVGFMPAREKFPSCRQNGSQPGAHSSCFSAKGKEERINRHPPGFVGNSKPKSGAVAMFIATKQ